MTAITDIDAALESVARHRRHERRRAWAAVLVPTLAGLAFMAFGAWQLGQAQRDVAQLRAQAADYGAQVKQLEGEVQARSQRIDALESELGALQLQLQETTQLSRFEHPVDMVDDKSIHSRWPGVARVLSLIMQQRRNDVAWRLGGTQPEQGFDSPSFAAWVLARFDALPPADGDGRGLLQRSRALYDTLPRVTSPEPGDVVFYPAGYALFYFLDKDDRPFVIGMTPSGIVALEPDFAEPVGVARPDYR